MTDERTLLAASLECADPLRLGDVAQTLERCGVDRLHVDMMDGRFVPNLAAGFSVVEAVCGLSLPVEVHVMAVDPERFLDRLAGVGVDLVLLHVEALRDPQRTVEKARDSGVAIGLAVSPQTPLATVHRVLPKLDQVVVMGVEPGFAGQTMQEGIIARIARVRRLCDRVAFKGRIEIDGGLTWELVPAVRAAGATVLVAGTHTIFSRRGELAADANRLRLLADRPLLTRRDLSGRPRRRVLAGSKGSR